jgi:hypothetical protein
LKSIFSTKFLEELEYKPEELKPKPKTVPKKVRLPVKEPERIVNERPAALSESEINSYAIDIAEKVYQQQVEQLVRQLAENAFREELNFKFMFQKPLYESILEPTLDKMIREIAQDALQDHQRKIQILQSQAIKKVAREQIVSNLMLDHMLDTVAQHGKSETENDDVAKLLDS